MIQEKYEGEAHRTLGRCRELSLEMAEVFKDLTVTKGHVHCVWGKRGHWWLVDNDGTIVDPTRGQFIGPIEYEEYEEGDEVRLGTCMDCGDGIWGVPGSQSSPFCNTACEESTRAYLNGGAL